MEPLPSNSGSFVIPQRPNWQVYVCGAVCVLALIIFAGLFAPQQALWGDEATQLSGLTLGPVNVVYWLAGEEDHHFGVPPDRMPPLSYWCGFLWSKIFGFHEMGFRWMGLLVTAVGVGFVYETIRRIYGTLPALLGGLVFALSPNVITMAVEIRAYPFFLTFSAIAFYCMVRILEELDAYRTKWVVALIFSLSAAMYTHFFGVVVTAAIVVSLLVMAWRVQARMKPILVAGGLLFIVFIGLIPFVVAAFGLGSPGAIERNQIRELVRLVYRLFSHASLTVYGIVFAGALASAAVLLGASLMRKVRKTYVEHGVLLALVVGFVCVAFANFAVNGFKSAEVTYNVWMLPGVAILIGSAMTVQHPSISVVVRAVGMLLVAMNLIGATQLVANGDAFSHGPSARIEPIVEQCDVGQTAIIHEHPLVAQVYFPLRYRFGKHFRQWVHDPVTDSMSEDNGLVVRRMPSQRIHDDAENFDNRYLIVVNARNLGAIELKEQLYQTIPFEDGPITEALLKSPKWERVDEQFFIGWVGATVDVFQRTGVGSTPTTDSTVPSFN